MKATHARVHSPVVEQLLAREHGVVESDASPRRVIEVARIYEQHADFLWRSLQHLGIRDADLEDTVQEVLVVVHRKRHSFDFECRVTTWLFGICLRVASRHRRRAYFRWERPAESVPEQVEPRTPEDRLVERRAKAQPERLLTALTPEHRAAFVLFEIEGQSCQEIAELFGVPVGTVYSRLHAARKHVAQSLVREQSSTLKGVLK